MKRVRPQLHYRSANVESDETCVVCFKHARIRSVGCCDHRVCFECSTRMRVLCERLECPICRQENPFVVFTNQNYAFDHYNESHYRSMIFDKQFGIYFETAAIHKHFLTLVANNCVKCGRNFDCSNDLNGHLQDKHQISFCKLCLNHLKIFTSERQYYSKNELKRHLVSGDRDDTSHKGHPLCEFCNDHYMDNDELFRHMRRDHLYCYFCDADGTNHFYGSRQALNKHMRDNHHSCEDDDCGKEEFVVSFRTDIELKKHKATHHNRGHSRAEQRQMRTLDLDIKFKSRNTYAKESYIFNPFNVVGESNGDQEYVPYTPVDEGRKCELNENNFPSLECGKKNSIHLNSVWDKRNCDPGNKMDKNNENNRRAVKQQDAFPALCKKQPLITDLPVKWAPEPKKEQQKQEQINNKNAKQKKSGMVSLLISNKRNEFPELKTVNNQPKLPSTVNNIQLDALANTSNSKKKKKKKSQDHKFIQPPNFQERNKKLGDKFLHLFNMSLVDEFRKKSQSYREGFVNVQTFYSICQELMAEKFMELFVELLVLLPDIRKQIELYEYHSNECGYDFRLQPCSICNQILFRNEVDYHKNYHNNVTNNNNNNNNNNNKVSGASDSKRSDLDKRLRSLKL